MESDRISQSWMERYIGLLLNRGWEPVVDYDTPFGITRFQRKVADYDSTEIGSLQRAIEVSVQQQEAYIRFGKNFPFEKDNQHRIYRGLLSLNVEQFHAPKGLDRDEDCETTKPFLEVGFNVDLIQVSDIPGAYEEIYELSCSMFESLNPLYGFGDGSDWEYMRHWECRGPSYPEILGDGQPSLF